jgi:hypothetical protein
MLSDTPALPRALHGRLLPLAAPCSLMPFLNAKSRFSKCNCQFHRFSLTPLTPWRSQSSSRRLCYRCVQRASSTNPPHRRCPPHSSQRPQWMFRRWTQVLLLIIRQKMSTTYTCFRGSAQYRQRTCKRKVRHFSNLLTPHPNASEPSSVPITRDLHSISCQRFISITRDFQPIYRR